MIEFKYTTWEGLVEAIEAKIPEILTEEVAPYVENVLKKHIQNDIFDAYTPIQGGWVKGTTYERRMVNGQHMLINDVTHFLGGNFNNILYVTSTSSASPSVVKGKRFVNRRPGAFLEMIQSGRTGIWRKGFRRPAVANTMAELRNSEELRKIIDNAINKVVGG